MLVTLTAELSITYAASAQPRPARFSYACFNWSAEQQYWECNKAKTHVLAEGEARFVFQYDIVKQPSLFKQYALIVSNSVVELALADDELLGAQWQLHRQAHANNFDT